MNRCLSRKELMQCKVPVWIYNQNTAGQAMDFTNGRQCTVTSSELLEFCTDDYTDPRAALVFDDGSKMRLDDYGKTWIAFQEKLYEPLPASKPKPGEWAVISEDAYLLAFGGESGMVTSFKNLKTALAAVKERYSFATNWRSKGNENKSEYLVTASMPMRFGNCRYDKSWSIVKVGPETTKKLNMLLTRKAV